MSSHRFLSRWLIRPVLHRLIRHQIYPRGQWYENLFDRELVSYSTRDDGPTGWIDLGPNVGAEDVAAFRRWWNQREAK